MTNPYLIADSSPPTLDEILDEPFHWCAFQAIITESRAVQGWPDPEKTRQTAYGLYEAHTRKEPPMSGNPNFGARPSDEDYELMEDKRLARQGIDPDGDPVRNMQEVSRRYRLLQQECEGLDFNEEEREGLRRWGIDPDGERAEVIRQLRLRYDEMLGGKSGC